MQRRKFLSHSLATAASALTLDWPFAAASTPASTSAEKPFQLNYAPHDGMFANQAGKRLYRPDTLHVRSGLSRH